MPSSTPNNLQISWRRSIRFPLLVFYVLLVIGVGGAAFFFNQQTLEKPLNKLSEELFLSQQERVFDQVQAAIANATQFSLALNAITATQWGQEQNLRQLSEALLNQLPDDTAIVAAGIWPEPNSFNKQRIRNSFYWTVNDANNGAKLSFHGDYNDTNNISYQGELWYQPARHYRGSRCYWTNQFIEPFLRKPVVSCAIPVYRGTTFLGVTSLVLDMQRLATSPQGLSSSGTFYALLDYSQNLLSASGLDVQEQDTLPALAQRDKRFGPVAVHLHQAQETKVSKASAADENWQSKVNALIENTRDLSRLQAEQLLARLGTTDVSMLNQSMRIDTGDLSKTAVRMNELPGLGTLLVGQYRPAAIAGVSLGWLSSAASTAGAIALALLFAYIAASRLAVAPMRRLLTQLQRPAEDTILEPSGQHELSALATLFNNRHERIRILLDRLRAQGVDTAGIPRQAAVVAAGVEKPSTSDAAWAVLDAFTDSVVITDQDGKIRHLNSAAEALSGSSLAQAKGQSFDEVFYILDRRGKNRLAELATRAIKAGRRSERPLQATFKTRSGHELPIAISSAPLNGNGETQGALITLHDARTGAPSAPAQAQVRDTLTGTLNRQAFDAELASRCDSTRIGGEPAFSLLYVDVDHMQTINDAFGTPGGDEFLRQLTRLIQSDVGDGNPVYRLHGDKFAVLLATDDSAEAQVIAELLRADVQSWGFQWKGEKRDVSISASLLQIDKSSGRPVDILRTADELCQQAQTEGRGRVLTAKAAASRGEVKRDDKSWLTNIKRGLAEDRFHLSTQQLKPLQRNADLGTVFDTYLLLEDDEGFWASASSFMPVAERHNMAEQLDRWTIEQIFSKLSHDPDLAAQLDFCLLPISASSMQSPQFLDFMFEQFKDSGIAPAKICLDLKERDVHTRLSSARDFCLAMTRAGCRVSLSDVSTRPSSYGLIKELPASIVRFDPILTRHADKDPVDRLATESLHRIVHTLGKHSMVTQINSPELLRIIQGIGVDYGQGDAVARVTPILFQAKV